MKDVVKKKKEESAQKKAIRTVMETEARCDEEMAASSGEDLWARDENTDVSWEETAKVAQTEAGSSR